jgi:hypothetical protein
MPITAGAKARTLQSKCVFGTAKAVPFQNILLAGDLRAVSGFEADPFSLVSEKLDQKATADPSTHHPQTEERLGPLSLRMTASGVGMYFSVRTLFLATSR